MITGEISFQVQAQDNNKTARIRAKPWMFRLPLKVYEAVKNNMKKLNVKKENKMKKFCEKKI